MAPLASQPGLGLGLAQADEAGTEPDPERDEILAAQVVFNGWGFSAEMVGEDLPSFLVGNLSEGC